MTTALVDPTEEALTEHVTTLCSTGLSKIGGCFDSLLNVRPFSTSRIRAAFKQHYIAGAAVKQTMGMLKAKHGNIAVIEPQKNSELRRMRVGLND